MFDFRPIANASMPANAKTRPKVQKPAGYKPGKPHLSAAASGLGADHAAPGADAFAGFSGSASASPNPSGFVAGSTAGKTVASDQDIVVSLIPLPRGEGGCRRQTGAGVSRSSAHRTAPHPTCSAGHLLPLGEGIGAFVGVILFARVDAATAARLDAGAPTLRPADWQSGQATDGKLKPDGTLRIIDIIAPFGGREEMETEFAGAVLFVCTELVIT